MVGIEDSFDIEWVRKVVDYFGWVLRERIFEVEDVRDVVKRVMYVIEEFNLMNFVIGLLFYFVFGLVFLDGMCVFFSG